MDESRDPIIHAVQRIDWTHVVNGLDLRGYELQDHEQYGRLKAHQDTVDAVQDLLSVLREFGLVPDAA